MRPAGQELPGKRWEGSTAWESAWSLALAMADGISRREKFRDPTLEFCSQGQRVMLVGQVF